MVDDVFIDVSDVRLWMEIVLVSKFWVMIWLIKCFNVVKLFLLFLFVFFFGIGMYLDF